MVWRRRVIFTRSSRSASVAATGARGAAASAEAADVVLLVDRLDRILPGLQIAQGARRIALQSVFAGIGLSVIGMIAAGFGLITPVEGAVSEEAIDVAVRIAELPDSSLQAIRIGSVRRLVCAAPDYLARHGAPERPADLAEHATIDFVNLSRAGDWAFEASGRRHVARHRPRFSVNVADAAIAAAVAGRGLTRVLSYMVVHEIAAGRLVTVLDDFAPPPTPVHVLHREPGMTSARVRAVVDHLAADLRQSPLLLPTAGP